MRRFVEREPGVQVRPGSVHGLVASERAPHHVTGVRLRDGQEVHGYLIVDAAGRRSTSGRWLGELGLDVVLQMAQGDFAQIPRGQILSFLHLMSVGGATNALLAFVIYLSRRVSATSWIDDVVFWSVNVGVIGFVVALTTDVRALVILFVPLMGLGLLVAIAAHLVPLRHAPPVAVVET